jgi:Flp pilus assembly protein protease CpaA
MSDLSFAASAAAAIAGAGIDLRTGRIPNVLTATTAAAGLGFAAAGLTGTSLVAAALGGALGLALMMPGHLVGGTGAGDVKLMGALGTLVGPGAVVVMFLASAIAGGVLAIGHAWRRGRMSLTVVRTARLAAGSAGTKAAVDAAAPLTKFAYGPAIAIGAIVAALWR